MKKRLTVIVQGRVQGVFFRNRARSSAMRLHLCGFTQNTFQGHVRIVAEGGTRRLAQFLDWCYHGSKLAKVESLHYQWEDATGEFTEFSIVREGNYLQDKVAALEHLSSRFLGSRARLPRHVAIIPDGNRRWAKKQKLEILQGHERGILQVVDLMDEAHRLDIPYFTMWGFSTENWNRSSQEVKYLMNIFRDAFPKFKKRFFDRSVRFSHFGRKNRLPDDILTSLSQMERETAHFTERHFGLALDYGGRDEIVRTVQRFSESGLPCSEENFSRFLDTSEFPDPDLIIRTSGERRLSGLMPWQGVYSELYFSPLLFPDFGVEAFRGALNEFVSRGRRFGS